MKQRYDAVIVGGGPAGLSAALYLARARFSVLVLEKADLGGQITITAEVVNYPGVYQSSGSALTQTMRRQAERFGAVFQMCQVESVDMDGDIKVVHTNKGDIEALGVILATGANPRKAGFAGEEEFRGQGVAYCATCDGEFFTGKDIYVIGGGFAAVEESLFLTRYGRKVHMLVRSGEFRCTGPVVDEVLEHPDITVSFHTEVLEVSGSGAVQSIRMRDTLTGEERTVTAADGEFFGLFVFAGYEPENRLAKGKVTLSEAGYIVTDRQQRTNVPGIYAAGDICVKELRQVVTAVADGAVAATDMEKYLAGQYRTLGLKREKLAVPETRTAEPEAVSSEMDTAAEAAGGAFLDASVRQALAPVFQRMERPLVLRVYEDGGKAGRENRRMAEELAAMSEKITVEAVAAVRDEERNVLAICDQGGRDLGLRFHGVPGGHEFNSFAIALYNAAGPGQALDEDAAAAIEAVHQPVRIQIYISLSCTMCPDLVMAAQRLASASSWIETDVYDISYYPEIKEKLNIMSVPCMQINGGKLHFGKKNIAGLLSLLKDELAK